jgi:hypothetical protein
VAKQFETRAGGPAFFFYQFSEVEMTHYFVQPQTSRPDFRLVIAFLWRDSQDVDTDGNSDNPASRDWTELYVLNREHAMEVFRVEPIADKPLTLSIGSELGELAARVAYFIATETKSLAASREAGPWHDPEWLANQVGNFNLAEATARAARSRWRQATIDNPYPQLS